MFSLHFLLDLAAPLGAVWTTLAVSADVKEQQCYQGPFGSLNPSPSHAERGHKPSVTCIHNLILSVTTHKPHDHIGQGTHGRLTRKQLEVMHKIGGQSHCPSSTLWHTWIPLLGSQDPVNGAAHHLSRREQCPQKHRSCLSLTLL